MANLLENSEHLSIRLESFKNEVTEGERAFFDILLCNSAEEPVYLKEDITFTIKYVFNSASSNDVEDLIKTITIPAGSSRITLSMDKVNE